MEQLERLKKELFQIRFQLNIYKTEHEKDILLERLKEVKKDYVMRKLEIIEESGGKKR